MVASLRQKPAASGPEPAGDQPDFELIELLFYAYRDFVGEPDRLLAGHGFGRAHHRVLHFVSRHEGLTVAELLEILKITKQSLARVLKDLVDGAFIEQRAGKADRRQRRLHLTAQGRDLARALAGMQDRRIARAIAMAAPGAEPVARAMIARFLAGLVDPERPAIAHSGENG